MRYLPIIVLLLTSCVSYDARLARVENHQNYVTEILRNRRMSPARCETLSDETMKCALVQNQRCKCQFVADDQDRDNAVFEAAVKRAAEVRAQEQPAKAERKEAAEE